MRLKIAVREGDWVKVSYSPYGNGYAFALHQRIASGEFTDGSGDQEGTAALDRRAERLPRWADFEKDCLKDTFDISVSDAHTPADVQQLCLAKAYRIGAAGPVTDPPPQRVWLTDPATDEQLDDSLTLRAAGVQDGDLLVLCVQRPAHDQYSLDAARNPAALFEKLQLAANAPAAHDSPRLWGLLLYSEADHELATYVRTHFDDLHALSGPATRVFVVERRTDWRTAKRYWRDRLPPDRYRTLGAMQWLRWQPYDPEGARAFARTLGVDPRALPCLVYLCDPREGLRDSPKIVFSLEEATPRAFRSLFGSVSGALRPSGAASWRETVTPASYFKNVEPLDIHEDHPRRRVHEQYAAPEKVLRDMAAANRVAGAAAFAKVYAAEEAINAALRPPSSQGEQRRGLRLENCRITYTSGAPGDRAAP